jgi:hypothetical protein
MMQPATFGASDRRRAKHKSKIYALCSHSEVTVFPADNALNLFVCLQSAPPSGLSAVVCLAIPRLLAPAAILEPRAAA